MDGLEGTLYPWLTGQVIAQIEEQLNPASLAFPPPKSWSCSQLDMALKKAYKTKFPDAKREPDYERPRNYVSAELNRILERRMAQGSTANSIETWRNEKFPGNEPFSSVALVEGMNVGLSPSAPTRKNQNSPESTLPLQSQCTPSSSITSVSTGLGTITLTGNGGEPSSHKSENSGPSPRRGTLRKGRGGSNPPRPGAHMCSFNGCEKKFQYPSKLKDHEHTHLDKKDYACRLGSCVKSFKRMRELKAHERTHPSHVPEMEPESGDQEMADAGQMEREGPARSNMMGLETSLSPEQMVCGGDPGHTTQHQSPGGNTVESEIDLEGTSPDGQPPNKIPVNREPSPSPSTPAGPGTPSAPTSPVPERYQPDPSPVLPTMPLEPSSPGLDGGESASLEVCTGPKITDNDKINKIIDGVMLVGMNMNNQ